MSPRLACLLVPSFPLAARLRAQPDLKQQPIVVLEGKGHHARVIAATPAAAQAGVQRGLSWPQARSRHSQLIGKPRDEEAERAAQEALLGVADAFSPRIQSGKPGQVYLDITGTNHERDLGLAMVQRAAAAGLPASVGVASTKLAAFLAAQITPEYPTIVPAGQEPAFLAPLPLNRLAPPARLAETLQRWGLKTLGDLANLPPGKILSHLGKEGVELHKAARGLDAAPFVARRPRPQFFEGMEIDWPLMDMEAFLHVAKNLLELLAVRLEAAGLACRSLELTMKLDPQGHDARTIAPAAPTRDLKTLLGLLRLEMEARPPQAAVIGMSFLAQPEQARQAQLSLFGPKAIAPDRLSTTLARLATIVGQDRIGTPAPVDSHRPERLTMKDYNPPPPPDFPGLEIPARRSATAYVAVRVLRPAVSLEVTLREGRPVSVRSTANGAETLRLYGQARTAAGPWRMEEGWWTEDTAHRDYWDVELSDRTVYRIFLDRTRKAWYADGIYD